MGLFQSLFGKKPPPPAPPADLPRSYALFHTPVGAIAREALLEEIASVLGDFDLAPPSRVALSTPALAKRDGAWAFAFGVPADTGRRVGRGSFMDAFGYTMPIGFLGRDDRADEEVFDLQYPAPDRVYIVSRGVLIGGDVTASPTRAIETGLARTKVRVGIATLAEYDLFAFDGSRLTPATGPFSHLVMPGLEADQDKYPTAAAPARTPTAPVKRELDLDQAMELENRVGAILMQGGDLVEARALIERVLTSFPRGTRALALHGKVLVKLGSDDALPALARSFESGLTGPGIGAAQIGNIAVPARDLAKHLISVGRGRDAIPYLDRAIAVLHPDHARELVALRAQLA